MSETPGTYSISNETLSTKIDAMRAEWRSHLETIARAISAVQSLHSDFLSQSRQNNMRIGEATHKIETQGLAKIILYEIAEMRKSIDLISISAKPRRATESRTASTRSSRSGEADTSRSRGSSSSSSAGSRSRSTKRRASSGRASRRKGG